MINRTQNEEQNLKAVRLSMKGYVDQEWMENVPLYATASFFKKIKHNSSIWWLRKLPKQRKLPFAKT